MLKIIASLRRVEVNTQFQTIDNVKNKNTANCEILIFFQSITTV